MQNNITPQEGKESPNPNPKYFRNSKDIISRENIEVDAGSLWKLNEETNILILEDDDQYATAILSPGFEKAL